MSNKVPSIRLSQYEKDQIKMKAGEAMQAAEPKFQVQDAKREELKDYVRAHLHEAYPEGLLQKVQLIDCGVIEIIAHNNSTGKVEDYSVHNHKNPFRVPKTHNTGWRTNSPTWHVLSDDPVAVLIQELKQVTNEANDSLDTKTAKINNILDSCNTTRQLEKAWPTITHFYPDSVNEKIREARTKTRKTTEVAQEDMSDIDAAVLTAKMTS